jgi:hypothetical protein
MEVVQEAKSDAVVRHFFQWSIVPAQRDELRRELGHDVRLGFRAVFRFERAKKAVVVDILDMPPLKTIYLASICMLSYEMNMRL